MHSLSHLIGLQSAAMAGSPSPLTTHVLNTAMGVPGSNMVLSLYKQDVSTSVWRLITTGYNNIKHCTSNTHVFICSFSTLRCLNRTTNEDGRCPGLVTKELFLPGMYKMHFDTAQYWASMGQTCFYPYVEVSLTSSSGVLL